MAKNFDLGIMFRCLRAPEELVAFVQKTEAIGFDEVWVVEDCFFAGGVSSMTMTLARTEHIKVGLGIMPAVSRNAAFTAMEIAALARLFPGRTLPGLGHGVGEWMKQIGAFPKSQLAALEEVTATVRDLLRGKLVNYDGKHVHLRDVQLEFPPDDVPPISLGVRGPKSLQVSGRVADGTILAEYASPAYVKWAIEQIKVGQQQAGRKNEAHRVTVYAWCLIDEDRENAINKLRPRIADGLASGNLHAYLAPLGITEDVQKLLDEGGVDKLASDMPEEWITQLAVVGTPDDCRDAIQKLADAGADSVVFVPVEDDLGTLEQIGSSLLPLFS